MLKFSVLMGSGVSTVLGPMAVNKLPPALALVFVVVFYFRLFLAILRQHSKHLGPGLDLQVSYQ